MERKQDADRLADEIASRLMHLADRTTPTMRCVRREYSRLLAQAAPGLVVRIALQLAHRPGTGFRFVAYEIVANHRAAFKSLEPAKILQLGKGLDSWGATDCFGSYLSGPAWRDGKLSTAVIAKWARSGDHWWRRAALVSTVALSRRGQPEDVSRTVEICALLASDNEDMVAKALSWALRELAKQHPEDARSFLDRYQATLPARVKREVQNKIATGVKNPPRRLP